MRSLFVTLILLFSSLSFAQNSINLTSWNIEWLSIDGGKVSRTPQDFEKLTHYVDKTQADILAFQEVERAAAIQKAVGNDFTIYLSDRSNTSNRHLQFNDTNQYTGFAVRNGVSVLDKPDFSITRGNSKLRFASYLVLNPNQENETHLLSVHLKAGCSGAYRNNRDCKIVKQQGQALAKWIMAREDNKQHYVVLGDFNHNLGYQGDWLWDVISDNTSAKLVTKETKAECKVRSNRNPNKTHQFRSVIDHIIASGDLKASSGVQTVFKTQDVLDYKLSDHCPVSTTLTF
ncbi:endonuclease/exonuclease/phosphatase family protein [Vibrio alginolyticus]|uniref:endonuclease/exonuclease/phosphatase family protein n=1 Tax=Vibrio alginolyticus TaxID=663 RepID=UPI00215C980C|nr:endonuclease/exonuclease/phosphatase family protein [Vibrio alginolyticus]MCR9323259.1 endonuclease/exonuclease/phosphatase family protein [Vibrio alginolyticus]MCR9524708.1 endonuclease/exonuclease/phosphatase family protein [Vibrio alginolyticus]